MSEIDDKSLLAKFRNPDTQHYAFNLLVRKYQEKLYWHVRRMVIEHEDANDVIQNVLIKVWKNLGNFREGSKLYTWLYRIATNESLTFLNKKKKKFFAPIDDDESDLSNRLKADPFFDGDEVTLKLKAAIHALPEKQQLVFNMRYYDEMTYEDISDVLGTSVGALKASYHHAVKKIEKFLKDD